MEVEIYEVSPDFHPTQGSEFAAGYDVRAHLTDFKPNRMADVEYPNKEIMHNHKNVDGVDVDTVVITIPPKGRAKVYCGCSMALPVGYEAQMRPRSGMAMTVGLGMANTPGTIDADYRGQVSVVLINLGKKPISIKHGDRIGQMVFNKHESVEKWNFVNSEEELINGNPTKRGEGGFGHTGVRQMPNQG